MRSATAVITLAAAVLLTACGDEAAKTMSKREYIARSNAICERTVRQAGEQYKRIVGEDGPPPPGQDARFVVRAQRFLKEAAIPAIRENVDERRQLPAPGGDEAQIKAIIAAGVKALAQFDRLAADRSRVRALWEGETPDPAKQFDGLSKRYGITHCAGET